MVHGNCREAACHGVRLVAVSCVSSLAPGAAAGAFACQGTSLPSGRPARCARRAAGPRGRAGARHAAAGPGCAGLPVPQPHPPRALRAVHARAGGRQRPPGRHLPRAPDLRAHAGASAARALAAPRSCRLAGTEDAGAAGPASLRALAPCACLAATAAETAWPFVIPVSSARGVGRRPWRPAGLTDRRRPRPRTTTSRASCATRRMRC